MSMEWMSPLVNLPSWSASQAAESGEKTGEKQGVGKACREFEAYFTASLFSEMTKSLEIGQKSGTLPQEAEWMWKMIGQTVAEEISRSQSLGLGKQLEQSALSLGLTPEGLR